MIGKLQRVPLREVWRHEALDFSWLEDNSVAGNVYCQGNYPSREPRTRGRVDRVTRPLNSSPHAATRERYSRATPPA
jgi:hypothetical protein